MATQIELFNITWTNKLTETLGFPRESLTPSHYTGPFRKAQLGHMVTVQM